MAVVSFLRRQTTGRILSILLGKFQVSHRDLAERLDISSQALSWQMKRLKDSGIVGCVREEIRVNYFLNDAGAIAVRRWVHLTEKR